MSMSNTSHTPLPWTKCGSKVMHGHGGTLYLCECNIAESAPEVIAPLEQQLANAQFIVQACNSHEALLEVAQMAASTLTVDKLALMQAARAAIAKATNPNAGAAQAYPAGRWTQKEGGQS